jgi:hypothetical protein
MSIDDLIGILSIQYLTVDGLGTFTLPDVALGGDFLIRAALCGAPLAAFSLWRVNPVSSAYAFAAAIPFGV